MRKNVEENKRKLQRAGRPSGESLTNNNTEMRDKRNI